MKPMVQMVAVRPHRYGQSIRRTGEHYYAHVAHVRFLETAGRARQASLAVPGDSHQEAPKPTAAPVTEPKHVRMRTASGRYARRDMRASR